MDPHLLNITIGLVYIVAFGGLSFLRREGLSGQFAFEVLGGMAIAEGGALLTGTTIHPILFLIIIYLPSMRVRLLVDIANLLSARGRQRDAVQLLQFALRIFPDAPTRLIVMANLGIIQLRRKNPESAQALLESVLEEAKTVKLGLKYEAACRYNLGLALQQQGKEAGAVVQFNKVINIPPNSMYSKAAARALEKRRGRHQERKQPADDEMNLPS